MNMNVVESATLAAIGYDDTRGILQLKFRGDAVYRYFGVPGSVHQGLLTASSKGGYFNKAIRGHFAHWRVPDLKTGPRGEA
jgi:hypothetical protein